MNKFMGLLVIGVSMWLVQCGGGGDCEPHDGKYCDECCPDGYCTTYGCL